MAYLEGVDVSYYQGKEKPDGSRITPNWKKAAAAGANYAYIRAGSITDYNGYLYEDTDFRANAISAPIHIPVGFYFYCRPKWDMVKQAEFFAELVNGRPLDYVWIDGTKVHLFPMLDFEEYEGATENKVFQFVSRVEKLTDMPCVIYGNPYYLGKYLGKYSWAAERMLSIANWLVDKPEIPDPWKRNGIQFTFWQYAVMRDGLKYGMQSSGLDHQVFNGTMQKLVETFKVGSTNPPPPTNPDQIIMNVTMTANYQSIDYKYQGEIVLEKETPDE